MDSPAQPFAFDAALLEHVEALRQAPRAKWLPFESQRDRDARIERDRIHHLIERENAIADLHSRWAAARGWRVSHKPATLAQLIWKTTKADEHGVLPEILSRLETSALQKVTLRRGPKGTRIALLLHTPLTGRDLANARNFLRVYGTLTEQLPFSFLNPRGLYALLVQRLPEEEDD